MVWTRSTSVLLYLLQCSQSACGHAVNLNKVITGEPAYLQWINVFRCQYSECLLLQTPPGHECGFMSVERMRILFGLDTVNAIRILAHSQKITPDIRFTCDGMITKWIIVAKYDRHF